MINKRMDAMSGAENILETGKLLGLRVKGSDREALVNINKHL